MVTHPQYGQSIFISNMCRNDLCSHSGLCFASTLEVRSPYDVLEGLRKVPTFWTHIPNTDIVQRYIPQNCVGTFLGLVHYLRGHCRLFFKQPRHCRESHQRPHGPARERRPAALAATKSLLFAGKGWRRWQRACRDEVQLTLQVHSYPRMAPLPSPLALHNWLT